MIERTTVKGSGLRYRLAVALRAESRKHYREFKAEVDSGTPVNVARGLFHDRMTAVGLAIVGTPIVLAAMGLNKLTGNDALYIDKRRGGSYPKIRTMHKDADTLFSPEVIQGMHEASDGKDHDPRVTTLGRIWRGSDIDELPSLYLNAADAVMDIAYRMFFSAQQRPVRRRLYGPRAAKGIDFLTVGRKILDGEIEPELANEWREGYVGAFLNAHTAGRDHKGINRNRIVAEVEAIRHRDRVSYQRWIFRRLVARVIQKGIGTGLRRREIPSEIAELQEAA